MFNIALLKSETSIETMRPHIDHRIIADIVARVRLGFLDTIVVEGRPGSGKTHLTDSIAEGLRGRRVPFSRVGMDEDVLPRGERGSKEIVEFQQGELVREALTGRENGCMLSYNRYNTESGCLDIPTQLVVQPRSDGLLLIEGVAATEKVMSFLSRQRTEIQDHVLYILLAEDSESANMRRAERDITVKGLNPEFVLQRIREQESCVGAYYKDLNKDLLTKSNLRTKTNTLVITE